MKKLSTALIFVFSLAGMDQPISNKNQISFTQKNGFYPLALPIEKTAQNTFKLITATDDNVYLTMQVIGTTQHGITIVNVAVPGNPLADPTFGILGQHEGKLYFVELAPECKNSCIGKNIDHLNILPLRNSKIKILYGTATAPVVALAIFGGYKAAQDILHWYKEKKQKQ